MAAVTSFIATLLTFVVVIAFIGWILFLIVYGFLKVFNKQRRLWVKYHLFGKKTDPKVVSWCIEAANRGFNQQTLRMQLLKKGKSMKDVEEIVFIFNEICKEAKINNVRSKKTDNKKIEYT